MKGYKGRYFVAGMVMVMAVGITACGDDASDKCKKIGDDFISSAIKHDISDMVENCRNEGYALECLAPYQTDYEPVDAILEDITYEIIDISCSTDDARGSITYEFTTKDYITALDSNPADVSSMIELMNASEQTVTFAVELEFRLTEDDDWVINNPDEFAEDFYGTLYNANFPFGSPLAETVEGVWCYCDSNNSAVYTHVDLIDLNITFIDELSVQSVYYTVMYNDEIIYKSENNRRIGCFYADQMEDSPEYLPAGTYTITFLDSHNRVVYSDSCEVNP